MIKRSIQISKISKLNLKSLINSDNFDIIQYLDTGNITKNNICDLQVLNTNRVKVPSRAKRRVRRNTIIYSTVRPNLEHYGFLENPNNNLIVSTGFTTIDIIDENVDPKFIYYLLTQKQVTDYLHNIAMNATSSYPSIKPEDIGNLNFQVPESLEDQQKIATVLSTLDAKIDLNNKINAELEVMAKTLYDYWFVQFDFPDKNGNPYKTSGGKMVWNQELKRDIPDGWSAISIGKLLSASKNGDWGENEADNNLLKVYCFRGADIDSLNGKTGDLNPPVRYIDLNHRDRLLKADDLIVEISGGSPTQSTGRIAHIGQRVFSRFNTPIVCSNFCKAISLKESKHSYLIKQYWNMLYEVGVFFNFEGKTSGIKNLLFEQLVKDIYIAMPEDDQLVEEYYNFSSKIDELVQNNLGENVELSLIRDWLLPMLMNGQVKVTQ